MGNLPADGFPAPISPPKENRAATQVRFAVVSATTLAAFLMYVDRACFAWILGSESFKSEISLDAAARESLKGAFFWAYALAQVPAGWMAERYGKRVLMSLMILTWSAFTALIGFADGLQVLLIARIGCGLAQAGAYPIAGSLLSRWAHPGRRAMASGVVALGGRVGLVLAPILTARIIAAYDWRCAGWIYGAAGIIAAGAFYFIFRETPEQHPACNDAERAYLAPTGSAAAAGARGAFPWFALVTDPSVWLMCGVQFLTNVGWAFALNSMSDHFKRVHHLSDQVNGDVSTLTLSFGIPAMLLGGFFTDFCGRRFGIRYGRLVPLVSTRFLAAVTFLLCIWTQQLWLLVVLFGMMIFWNDAGLPSMWAWAQDVGGRNVAPILGWANMWGNFGAALQPLILLWIKTNLDANDDGKEAFLACSAAFALSGILALGINCERPVARKSP